MDDLDKQISELEELIDVKYREYHVIYDAAWKAYEDATEPLKKQIQQLIMKRDVNKIRNILFYMSKGFDLYTEHFPDDDMTYNFDSDSWYYWYNAPRDFTAKIWDVLESEELIEEDDSRGGSYSTYYKISEKGVNFLNGN